MTAPALVTQASAARVLGVSRTRVVQLVTAGRLQVARYDDRNYVTRASLDREMTRRTRLYHATRTPTEDAK